MMSQGESVKFVSLRSKRWHAIYIAISFFFTDKHTTLKFTKCDIKWDRQRIFKVVLLIILMNYRSRMAANCPDFHMKVQETHFLLRCTNEVTCHRGHDDLKTQRNMKPVNKVQISFLNYK